MEPPGSVSFVMAGRREGGRGGGFRVLGFRV